MHWQTRQTRGQSRYMTPSPRFRSSKFVQNVRFGVRTCPVQQPQECRGVRRASSEQQGRRLGGEQRPSRAASVIKHGRAFRRHLAAGTCWAWREQRGGSHARQGPQQRTTWQAKRSLWLAEQPTSCRAAQTFGTAFFGSRIAPAFILPRRLRRLLTEKTMDMAAWRARVGRGAKPMVGGGRWRTGSVL